MAWLQNIVLAACALSVVSTPLDEVSLLQMGSHVTTGGSATPHIVFYTAPVAAADGSEREQATPSDADTRPTPGKVRQSEVKLSDDTDLVSEDEVEKDEEEEFGKEHETDKMQEEQAMEQWLENGIRSILKDKVNSTDGEHSKVGESSKAEIAAKVKTIAKVKTFSKWNAFCAGACDESVVYQDVCWACYNRWSANQNFWRAGAATAIRNHQAWRATAERNAQVYASHAQNWQELAYSTADTYARNEFDRQTQTAEEAKVASLNAEVVARDFLVR